MSKKKRAISMLVACAVISTCFAPTSLAVYEKPVFEQDLIEPRYEVISFISATLSISGAGKADCHSSVRVKSGYSVDLKAELQQNKGSGWSTIHDWAASGKNRVEVMGPWYVLSGYSYRLKVTATVYDSNGNFVEAPVEYSKVQEY